MNFEKLVEELKKYLDTSGCVCDCSPTIKGDVTTHSTKARDVLDFIVDASYDCGDLIMIPKRLIIEIKENIVD